MKNKKLLQKLRRHKRIKKALSGTEERPRLVVHKTLKHIYAQLVVDLQQGTAKVITGASTLSPELKEELGKKITKTDAAKVVGKLVAKRAIEKGISQIAFDRAGYKYIGRVKALAEGAREAGLKF